MMAIESAVVWKIGAVLGYVGRSSGWGIESQYIENCTKKTATNAARRLAYDTRDKFNAMTGGSDAEIKRLIVKRLKGEELRKYLVNAGQIQMGFVALDEVE